MSQAALNQIIRQISGDHVPAFFLVLARLSPLFLVAPLFSSTMVPRRVRATIAVGLAIGLTGVASRGQHIPTDALSLVGLIVEQLLVGLAFAYAVGAVFAAIEAAGALTDMLAGFSFGSLIDPVNGNQGGVLTSLYGLIGLALFVAVGGDAWTLRGVARTFSLVPLTKGPQLNSLVTGVEAAFASIFVSALEVAAPAVLALLITDVAFGLMSRVVPQLNVFAVGFPMKIGVVLLVIGAALPFVGGFVSDQIANAVTVALHSITPA